MPRRALRFLILLLTMWMGVTGAASAQALHAEPGPVSTDAATTVVRYVYDVDAQHAQAARTSLTKVAGSAGRDQEGTQRHRGSDFWVAPRTA